MGRYFFPLHLNSNNRGCEAIARGTIKVLNLSSDEYIGLSTNIAVDRKMGLDKIITLQEQHKFGILSRSLDKSFRMITSNSNFSMNNHYKMIYDSFLRQMDKQDVCFITGGDMLCYGDNEINYIVKKMHMEKKKIVLWGCSIGEENLTQKKREILNYFDCITARESLTYALLREKLGIDNVHLFPDPAFSLSPEETLLPDFFMYNCIGINISNFVRADIQNELFYKCLVRLVNYIIETTNTHIVFFPHVLWKKQDDRIACEYIRNSVNDKTRIHILNTNDLNYCKIRFAISKCIAFMGARTHSMISAYSTCVPSIAFGYSIKAKGIAKDLGIDHRLVVDYKKVKSENELIDAFNYLMNNRENIEQHLQNVIPEYSNRSLQAKSIVNII